MFSAPPMRRRPVDATARNIIHGQAVGLMLLRRDPVSTAPSNADWYAEFICAEIEPARTQTHPGSKEGHRIGLAEMVRTGVRQAGLAGLSMNFDLPPPIIGNVRRGALKAIGQPARSTCHPLDEDTPVPLTAKVCRTHHCRPFLNCPRRPTRSPVAPTSQSNRTSAILAETRNFRFIRRKPCAGDFQGMTPGVQEIAA